MTSNGNTHPVNSVAAIKFGVPSILYSTAGNHRSHLNPELITTYVSKDPSKINVHKTRNV